MKLGAEDIEQIKVVNFCRDNGLPYFHVPNSTYTKFESVKKRNKMMGVSPGVPDLFVLVGSHTIAIEMKSLTGTATKAQKEWINKLSNAGVPAMVCKGHKAAIQFISGFLNTKRVADALHVATQPLEAPDDLNIF